MNDPSGFLVTPSAPDESISNGFVNPVDAPTEILATLSGAYGASRASSGVDITI